MSKIKDLLFAVKHGFKGVPIMIGSNQYRVDESLRRWNFDSEFQVQEVIESVLNPGDTFIDVGANFGMHTLPAANCVGDKGKVIAFEPMPFNIQLLEKHLKLNGFYDRVKIHQAAVSDSKDQFLMMSNDADGVAPESAIIPAGGVGLKVRN